MVGFLNSSLLKLSNRVERTTLKDDKFLHFQSGETSFVNILNDEQAKPKVHNRHPWTDTDTHGDVFSQLHF